MKVSQRITISNFQTFHFQRLFLHQNFSLSCINRQLIYVLGPVVVAYVLNCHESQLLSMFCAQFNYFVIPQSPPVLIRTFTSIFCDYLYSSLCWKSYMGIKYSQYNAAASLFKSWLPPTPLFSSLFKWWMLFVSNQFCFEVFDLSESIFFFMDSYL